MAERFSISESRLEAVLTEWQRWPVDSQPRVLKHYTAGLNHRTLLLASGDQRFVLKLFREPHELAIKAQQWADRLAPEVLFADSENRYCLMSELRSPTTSPVSTNRSQLTSTAAALRDLHQRNFDQIGQLSGSFNIHAFCEQYLTSAGKRAAELHKKLAPIIDRYLADETPWRFCHNDLVAANCFINNDSAKFIDWEYAQIHNPWFDLAAIIYYLNLPLDHARFFLDRYQPGWGHKVYEPIYTASQCALLWGDMLWHLAEFGEAFWPQLEQKYVDLIRLSAQP